MTTEIQRIQASIDGCKAKIAGMEAGQRGMVSEGARHQDGGRASEAQLHAQRQALEKFELEYVQACLAEHKWPASVIIERMRAPAAAPSAPAQPVREIITVREGDVTRGRLQSVLENNPGNFVPRSKLRELLSK